MMMVVSLYLFCYKFYTCFSRFQTKKKKITSREIYVTFENNFENISQWEKKDKIKYLKEAMQM